MKRKFLSDALRGIGDKLPDLIMCMGIQALPRFCVTAVVIVGGIFAEIPAGDQTPGRIFRRNRRKRNRHFRR